MSSSSWPTSSGCSEDDEDAADVLPGPHAGRSSRWPRRRARPLAIGRPMARPQRRRLVQRAARLRRSPSNRASSTAAPTTATAKGPVPNLKKTAPPPPTPGLWQIHGLAKPGTFSLLAVASVKADDRREERLTATLQGSTLTVTESGGCGRTAHGSTGASQIIRAPRSLPAIAHCSRGLPTVSHPRGKPPMPMAQGFWAILPSFPDPLFCHFLWITQAVSSAARMRSSRPSSRRKKASCGFSSTNIARASRPSMQAAHHRAADAVARPRRCACPRR